MTAPAILSLSSRELCAKADMRYSTGVEENGDMYEEMARNKMLTTWGTVMVTTRHDA